MRLTPWVTSAPSGVTSPTLDDTRSLSKRWHPSSRRPSLLSASAHPLCMRARRPSRSSALASGRVRFGRGTEAGIDAARASAHDSTCSMSGFTETTSKDAHSSTCSSRSAIWTVRWERRVRQIWSTSARRAHACGGSRSARLRDVRALLAHLDEGLYRRRGARATYWWQGAHEPWPRTCSTDISGFDRSAAASPRILGAGDRA